MPYDLVIRNDMVIDGSGLPRYRADVGVRHGRIVTIGRIRERAREVIGNGEILLRDGKHTGALPGQLLRGPLARRRALSA